MDIAHKQMLTDSIVDKIMLIGRTADNLKARVAGKILSDADVARVTAELNALRDFVTEIAHLSTLTEFNYVEISAVYERLDVVIAHADAVRL
jgi:hypothetical protein